MSRSSAKRARWRVRRRLGVALSGAVVLVVARAALRRARTRVRGDATQPWEPKHASQAPEHGRASSEPSETWAPKHASQAPEMAQVAEPKHAGQASEPTEAPEPGLTEASEPTEASETGQAAEPTEAPEPGQVVPGLTEASEPAAAADSPHPVGEPAGASPQSSDAPEKKHRAVRVMTALVVLLVCAGVAIAVAPPGRPGSRSDESARRSGDVRHATDPPRVETVTSVVPGGGASGVAPDTTVAVMFSDPLTLASPDPSLSPAVSGSWQLVGTSELLFTPDVSFVPSTTYTVKVPGGPSGDRSRSGTALAQTVVSSFTISPGSVLRLQQLLAKLGYLPLMFSGTTPVPAGMAVAQPGSFAWRDPGFPASYTSQWSPTQVTALTRGAVMAFETQNGLDVDGTMGAALWTALLAAASAGKKDTAPVTYVLVTKNLPEHLTIWVNGVLTFAHVPCNTGVPGAPTTDGTYEVFEHVQVSNMQGTDVTGTSYDVTVPWASYFDGGEALHGYPRTAYGFPQSNGCVEMPISTAGEVWPSTPIGTLVTVVGPTA